MAINRATRYPGRWDAPTAEYPLGVSKNRTSETSEDGSYFNKDWINDYEAFFGALMANAGLTPGSTVDTATASQFYDALQIMTMFLEGDQTVNGIKTFTSSPIVPTPTAGANDTKAATTAFVKAKSELDSIGVNQTWQNVLGSRALGVTYTNNTGKPIMVSAALSDDGPGSIALQVDGGVAFTYGDGGVRELQIIVPRDSTYMLSVGTGTLIYWYELSV